MLVLVFQHCTLQEISELIQQRLLNVDAVKEYASHMCREIHFDQQACENCLPMLETVWKNNYKTEKYARLCGMPEGTLQEPTETFKSKSWADVVNEAREYVKGFLTLQ